MEHFCLLLLCFLAGNYAERIVFPDEYEKMTRYSDDYYTPPIRAHALGNAYNYYQSNPPPAFPITTTPQNRPLASAINHHFAPASQSGPPSLVDMLPPYWSNHVNNIISRGVTKFALDMNRAISDTSMRFERDMFRNVIFSPLSLAGTLAMVLLASSGKTFEEVARILGLQSGVDISNHSEIVHQMFGSIIEQINMERLPGEPTARYASGIFVQEGYPIRPEFRKISDKVYKSEVINLDFQRHPKYAQDAVNAWVRDRTNGKIANILANPPNPMTNVILASALYFSGEWNQYFIESITKRRPFNIEPGLTVNVDIMYNNGQFPFYEDKRLGVKIIGLPYKGKEVTMYILLPRAEGATALRNFERRLTPEIIDNLINNMLNQTCIIALPRMKLSSTLGLREALRSEGLVSLFDPATADLSLLSPGRGERPQVTGPVISRLGDNTDLPNNFAHKPGHFSYIDRMSGYSVEQWASGFDIRRLGRSVSRRKRQKRPIDEEFLNFVNSVNFPNYGLDNLRNSHNIVNPHLYADDVLHKVEINIDEKGTEAAAATAVTINRSGDQKRILVNRPFLFFIRHDPSKLIWFWGTVNTPEPHYPT